MESRDSTASDELSALKAIYGDENIIYDIETMMDSNRAICVSIRLDLSDADPDRSHPVSALCALTVPAHYPSSGCTPIFLLRDIVGLFRCRSLSRSELESINITISSIVLKVFGDGAEECLYSIIQRVLDEAIRPFTDKAFLENASAVMEAPQSIGSLDARTRNDVNGQRLLWFHHIRSVSKRHNIIDWARELQLCGVCKPGFPGAIFVAGSDESCTEFVRRVRGLSWQGMALKGQWTEATTRTIKDHKDYRDFLELDENNLAGVFECAGKFGLFEEVKELLMKIPPRAGAGSGTESSLDTNKKPTVLADSSVTGSDRQIPGSVSWIPAVPSAKAGARPSASRPSASRDNAVLGSVLITVQAKPNAQVSEVLSISDESVRIALAAAPRDGAANAALVDLLASCLRVPKAAVAVVGGGKNKSKVIRVDGISAACHVVDRLYAAAME